MKKALSLLALSLCLASGASDLRSQELAQVAPAQVAVPGEYLVHHATGVSLEALRGAIYSKASSDTVGRIIAELSDAVEVTRADFVREVEALGGSVIENFWLIEVSYVKLDPTRLPSLKQIKGVVGVEANMQVAPVLATSTNASNHNSDAANVTRGLSSGQFVVGTDLSVAILDTGIDSSMANNGRPHRSFFKAGDPSNTSGAGIAGSRVLGRFLATGASGTGEDDNGHGSSCASCSAGATWPGNDAGFAPDANIVSYKVSSASNGGASTAAIASGFQMTLANAALYKIVAANNSYSGSPSMTESAQQAADRCAYVGNINVCVPAGNSGSNITATQAGYNALNCGSINKNSATRSSFSGFGTQTSGKVIPDIAAIGASVSMTRLDSESTVSRASGTSFSSPSVAGAAVLVRHANPQVTALETKALLLRNTRSSTAGSGLGAGVLRADLAVSAAIRGEFSSGQLSATQPVADHPVKVTQGVRTSVALTWWRKNTSSASNNDLNLSVFDANNNLVASSRANANNSFERVEFVPATTGTYRARVDGTLVDAVVDYALAGADATNPPVKPTLTMIAPTTTPLRSFSPITLTGTDLAGVTDILIGSIKVPAKNATATSVQFDAPQPALLGPVSVKAKNAGGESNALTLTYVGNHPSIFEGPTLLVSNGGYTDSLTCDDGWIGVHFVSGSDKPSILQGVVSLGIGDNFLNLVQLNIFVCDKSGTASHIWVMPPGLGGLTLYAQVVALDGKTLALPFESSNILKRTVFF